MLLGAIFEIHNHLREISGKKISDLKDRIRRSHRTVAEAMTHILHVYTLCIEAVVGAKINLHDHVFPGFP
jgi:hypothetical protein